MSYYCHTCDLCINKFSGSHGWLKYGNVVTGSLLAIHLLGLGLTWNTSDKCGWLNQNEKRK